MSQLTGATSGRGALRAQLAAVTFLTQIPLPTRAADEGQLLAAAAPAFPIVGAGIGAVVAAIATALSGPLTPLLAVAIGLAGGTLLTGALHLDAIADTADALGGRTREAALAIMRDHAIGAYGAVALTLDLLIKTAALVALVGHGQALRYGVVAGALSRCVAVALAFSLPYARSQAGLGLLLGGGGCWRGALAFLLALGVAVAAAGNNGLLLVASAAALCLALRFSFSRWIGGVTGDTLGAAVELCEVGVLVVAVALVGAR